MSWLQTAAFALRSPDPRQIRVVEQEILDELEFHLEMRTLDNANAGMSVDKARQDAVRRFGDFDRIHKVCRRILLGERIMLQRVQTILTVVLLGAVVFLGVEFYRGQRANETATARMMQTLDNFTGPSVVQTVPKSGNTDVDPSLTEIRVTYNMPMMDESWSWCYDPNQLKTTGKPRYEADGKTCVLPVKLEPGKSYAIRLNSGDFRNFKNATGQPAIPYLLQFTTRREATADGVAKPQPSPARPVDRRKSGLDTSGKVALPAVEAPPPNLKYRTAGSDEDVKTLIARVLKANSPWIEPKPVKATYSLLREADETKGKERNGPFSVQKGCKRAIRVGSIVYTPLHSMAKKNTPYTVRMVGKTEWKGKNLVAVDVTFDPPVRSGIGLGGQGNTNYSSCESSTATARIVFESTRAIPLVIDCWSEALGQIERSHCVWAFDPDFFSVDGAFAPKTFYWDGHGKWGFRERQEFQVVSGVWIFKQGDAWHSPESSFDESRHIQRVRLVDLQIAAESENSLPIAPKDSAMQ